VHRFFLPGVRYGDRYLCRLPAANENVACLANWALIASNTPWFMASF